MNLRPHQLFSKTSHRLLLAALLTLPLYAACGDDESAQETPVDFSIAIVELDGGDPLEPVTLRCDDTLAVLVAISASDPKVGFTLRPADACGESTRCGYVHLEALDADGGVLSSVDSVTTEGVLRLPSGRAGELLQVRAELIRGLDQKVVTRQDGSKATDQVSPTFSVPTDCPEPDGAGGQGGAAGASSDGGAAGQGGVSAGGQGGVAGVGGAAGVAGAAGQAGASLGGAPSVGGAPADAGAPASSAGIGGV